MVHFQTDVLQMKQVRLFWSKILIQSFLCLLLWPEPVSLFDVCKKNVCSFLTLMISNIIVNIIKINTRT